MTARVGIAGINKSSYKIYWGHWEWSNEHKDFIRESKDFVNLWNADSVVCFHMWYQNTIILKPTHIFKSILNTDPLLEFSQQPL